MRRSIITTVTTALLALILVSAASASVPNGVQNFRNLDAGLQPRATWSSNQPFRIKSSYNNQLLGYGNQTFGVDLQWGDHGDWTIVLADHTGRAVSNADRVALYNSKAHKYLVYGNQTFGIDLTWSSSPSYEWQIAGTGINRGLYSDKAHDYLEYGDETWGIDLDWQFGQVMYPPDYQPMPSGEQTAYVTLTRGYSLNGLYTGHLAYQAYHQAVVDTLQNTSQFPITLVTSSNPTSQCVGTLFNQGQIFSGAVLAGLTPGEQGSRPAYDIASCGAVPGTGNGSAPLVRVTFHYTS